MFHEVRNLDICFTIHLIADNEAVFNQLVKKIIQVAVVVGQDLGFDTPGSILKAALSVGDAPQAGEQDLALHQR